MKISSMKNVLSRAQTGDVIRTIRKDGNEQYIQVRALDGKLYGTEMKPLPSLLDASQIDQVQIRRR